MNEKQIRRKKAIVFSLFSNLKTNKCNEDQKVLIILLF